MRLCCHCEIVCALYNVSLCIIIGDGKAKTCLSLNPPELDTDCFSGQTSTQLVFRNFRTQIVYRVLLTSVLRALVKELKRKKYLVGKS